MKICTRFDTYRDGELSRIEEKEFQDHLAECHDCKAKMALLDNLAMILKKDPDVILQTDLSRQIARKAFQQNKTWDAIVLGWLRPGPAFAALSLICILFATLWIVPSYQPTNAFSEYEKLLDESNTRIMDSSISRIESDTELVIWLEQEAKSQ